MVAHPRIDTTAEDHILALRSGQVELARAVGRGQPALRDPSGNILALNPNSSTPLLMAQGHDVALSFGPSPALDNIGVLTVTDETGQIQRPIVASNFYGDVGDPDSGNTGNVYSDTHGIHYGQVGTPDILYNHYGDTRGIHFGQVGSPSELYNHWGDCHGIHFGQVGTPSVLYDHYGDCHGIHWGQVGTPSALYNHYGDCRGIHFGQCGTSGEPYDHWGDNHGKNFGDVGTGGQNWNLCGTVIAPSERSMKTDIREFDSAGAIVDAVPVYRWRWGPDTPSTWDRDEHAGPMVDDLDVNAPWLVRHPTMPGSRSYQDRDLVGVLWAALREERAARRELEQRVTRLEAQLSR